jgi:hypothetical protein
LYSVLVREDTKENSNVRTRDKKARHQPSGWDLADLTCHSRSSVITLSRADP